MTKEYKDNVQLTSETLGHKREGYGHHLKVLEESAELSEVLLKTITKAKGYKPPIDKIIEESGDLLFRIDVLAHKLGIKDKIQERRLQKSFQLKEYIETGKWKENEK